MAHPQALSFFQRSGFSNTTSRGMAFLSSTSESPTVSRTTTTKMITTFSTIAFPSSSSHRQISITAAARSATDVAIISSKSFTSGQGSTTSRTWTHSSTAPSDTSTIWPDTGPAESDEASHSMTIGIGVGVGFLGLILLTALSLFLFQKWRDRSARDPIQCRRARLWKGFTPATSLFCTERGKGVSFEKGMDEDYVKGLFEPSTPSPALSSPFLERHVRWSWQAPYSDNTFATPVEPSSTVFELPAHASRALVT
ncbi:hypothetical protein K491DRAFT_118351 [Lophiostoma macrostomum CBS 122681]|uniref:Mid2 domain-containing protein n=1 Tax=Lophiostoma macrostomum CBS 122681 TaxID=1314788 RepID=A0A6A6ST14_9PLEO|nr:hypothetical protein K491DRAFT_118351 [Lophiostoma macrostomum CBS 122681]